MIFVHWSTNLCIVQPIRSGSRRVKCLIWLFFFLYIIDVCTTIGQFNLVHSNLIEYLLKVNVAYAAEGGIPGGQLLVTVFVCFSVSVVSV